MICKVLEKEAEEMDKFDGIDAQDKNVFESEEGKMKYYKNNMLELYKEKSKTYPLSCSVYPRIPLDLQEIHNLRFYELLGDQGLKKIVKNLPKFWIKDIENIYKSLETFTVNEFSTLSGA
mmetsp:Transcript_33978/g.30749  ORF Transcript_33978/g.30749 Transcript_33978/m.30749 type:complete len:120 (+) Transcript_33978:1043-1402(+)